MRRTMRALLVQSSEGHFCLLVLTESMKMDSRVPPPALIEAGRREAVEDVHGSLCVSVTMHVCVLLTKV